MVKKAEKEKKEEKIILKSGLEIHQQLDAGKLFCSCPGILRQDKPDYEIERKLHVIAGEQGTVDEAVKFEAGRDKKFIYQGYYDSCCLVELDEEPPHQINQEALKITLQISLLLNCEILQTSQIMRKTVIDGSNTSGFQRTVIIARNGFVETSFGKIGIDKIMLEEDAARPAIGENDETSKVYKLDRLGIPLVEIATNADLHSAEQIKETALKIGEILRACKVKRGIGTIRQDLNISITGSERVEIKGFQDPKVMIKTVEIEVERQKKCVKEKNCKKEVRRALEDGTTSFLRPMPGASRMYPETDLPLLYISRDLINEAKNTLPRLKHEIKSELKAEGLSDEMIKLILEENKVEDYKELMEVYKKPDLIAKMLTLWQKEISSREKIDEEKIREKLNLDILESIINLIQKGKIQESQAKRIMEDIVKGKKIEDALRVEQVTGLEDEIIKLVKEKPGLTSNAYMGIVMARFKGKVSGKEVMEILKKVVKS